MLWLENASTLHAVIMAKKRKKDCFNKHGYSFDDVAKNGYSSPS